MKANLEFAATLAYHTGCALNDFILCREQTMLIRVEVAKGAGEDYRMAANLSVSHCTHSIDMQQIVFIIILVRNTTKTAKLSECRYLMQAKPSTIS